MRFPLIIVIAVISSIAQAEVYRWTDANGKVHYTDKKPTTAAENITEKVNKQNLDTSTDERKKVGAILRQENDADREFKQQQYAQEQQKINERNKRCNEARQYLSDISGRVQFIDENGKPIYVSEQERQAREKKWKAVVEQECP